MTQGRYCRNVNYSAPGRGPLAFFIESKMFVNVKNTPIIMAILKRDIRHSWKQHFSPMLKRRHFYLTVSVELARLISSLISLEKNLCERNAFYVANNHV